MKTRTVVVVAVAALVALASFAALGALAGSGASPADKVTAAGSKTVVMTGGPATDPILTATMSTSKPTDLILTVSAECSILTTVQNTGTSSTSTAHGQVRIWTEVDGQIVPVESVSNPPQNTPPGGDDSDKATFCERTHQVDLMQFTDPTDTLKQYQATKNADAFTWLRQNVGAGDHVITVHADLVTDATSNASAKAIIGNRTLVIDPTKMANNAIIAPSGSG